MRTDNNRSDRRPAVAGQFYPADSSKLQNELNAFFSEAKSSLREGVKPLAIISPHAGYVFSGGVAASAFNQIPQDAVYKRVFLIGSSHRYSFDGGAVFSGGDYHTPLGRVIVDNETAEELASQGSLFIHHNDAHLYEHSLEVQLPFLQQRLNSGFKLVPILLGTHNPEDCAVMAKQLEPWFNPENLFVISTDFAHYPDYKSAVIADRKTAEAIASNDPGKLIGVIDTNKKANIPGLVTSLCGWTSVLTLLYITADKPVCYLLADYKNSGDNLIYGDKHRVVGYEAIAVFSSENEFSLTEKEKNELIRVAREAIVNEISNVSFSERKKNGIEPITRKAGAFVSIYCRGELRGCIGTFRDDTPLTDAVRKMAVSATRDSRFKPLNAKDIADIRIEISVLTPLKRISSPEEIIIGKHGIYIKKDFYSGTFLPQVASSRNWTVEEFLGRCSRDKAGLGWEGWKKAELYTYEAIIIKEEPDSSD
jgi:MEMO1 family protein